MIFYFVVILIRRNAVLWERKTTAAYLRVRFFGESKSQIIRIFHYQKNDPKKDSLP